MTETKYLLTGNLWIEQCANCGRHGEIGAEIWMDADTNPVCADGCAADRWGANAQGE